MIGQQHEGATMDVDRIQAEMMGLLREPMAGQRWISTRQHKIWRPPTDVYETDTCVVVKVEIAGMEEDDFSISLDSRRLVIGGVRRDPAAKLGYQQMEILYGHFETDVHLPRAIEEEKIEATYQNGFLSVILPKAKPRQVQVVTTEDANSPPEESSR
jgi:HSP20 family molecular chaperone IbpA